MKPDPSKCPVQHLVRPSEPNKCPVHGLFGWCRERVSAAVSSLPFRKKNHHFDEFIKSSCAFADILLDAESRISQELVARTELHLKDKKPKDFSEAIEKLFIQYHTNSNGILHDDFLVLFRHLQIENRDDFVMASNENEEIYQRISNAYQLGMSLTYDIWRDVLRAYEIRYGRFPNPEEVSSITPFVVHFTHTLGQIPSTMAVPIRVRLINIHARPNIYIDEEGEIHFDAVKLKQAKHDGSTEVGLHRNATLKTFLTNKYCPGLSRIPKIAQMCCAIFEASYKHIYNQYQQ